MAPFEKLDEIVSSGFCIGCGLCASLVPGAEIRMRMAAHGHLRPVPKRPLTDAENARVARLCPGVAQNGPFGAPNGRDMDPVWGENRRVARGFSNDPDLRFRASSGGVMTAVNRQLLRSGRVAFILQTKPDPNDAFGSVATICRDEAALMNSGGSRYASSAPLQAIAEVLDLAEPFAVSLKPCDVAGLHNLQREDDRARDLIRFTQAMFCGTVPSFPATRGFFERRGIDIDAEPPAEFRWRGLGCPGPTRATMRDGRILQGTYNELWDENPWSTQFRCKICPDAVGLQADLAVGDDWPGALPKGENEGWNAMIAHTALGLEVLNECEDAGDLTLFDVDVRHLDDVQPHHVRLRQGLLARLAACSTVGLPAPGFSGLGLSGCADLQTTEELGRNYEGTLRRLRQGRGDEDQLADYGAATIADRGSE